MKAFISSIIILVTVLSGAAVFAESITIENLVRAESDTMFRMTMKDSHISIGRIAHTREVTSANDPQPVIRANQDTLYSASVVDLSKPVTVTLPEGDGRFQSVLVISQDHYNFAYAKPGAYKLTEEEVGTRFAMLLFRTFVDAGDPDDVPRAHAMQDAIVLEEAEMVHSRHQTGTSKPLPKRGRRSTTLLRSSALSPASLSADAAR